MKIGVLTAATAEAGDIAAIARETENLGYESLFIPEHPVIPIGFKTVPPGGGNLPEHYGRWMDPFIALSVAAAVTKRIKRMGPLSRNLRKGWGEMADQDVEIDPPTGRGDVRNPQRHARLSR